MFKKLLGKKGEQQGPGPSKPINKQETSKPSSNKENSFLDEILAMPFKVNLEDLYQYDSDELIEYIHKYDSFINDIKPRLIDSVNELVMYKENYSLIEGERRRVIEENELLRSQLDSLKSKISELTPKKPSNPAHPQSVEEVLQKNIKLCIVEENFLAEFKNSSDKLTEDIVKIRQLIEQANVPEGQDPNDENSICHVEFPNNTKAQIIGYMDDLSMMFQLLGPKFLEVNQKLQQKEKDIFEAVKTKFNEDLKSYGEKLEGDKLNEYKKENENLKARLMTAESELNELSIQVEDKVKAAQTQGQSEISEKLLNETIEQYNKEIRELQKRLTDTAGALSMSEKKFKELEAKQKETQAQSDKNFQDYQRIFQEYNNMITQNENSSSESKNEANTLRAKILTLEKEKEVLTKKAHDIEQSKNEYENKMIQEKLKHHHTQGDLQKVKENLDEAQKSLNEEIEGRKQEIMRSEELKKRINEYDKKLKDHKRTIKKLSQKILEIQETSDSKREDTLTRESQSKDDYDDDLRGDMTPTTTINQTHLLSTLHEKIKSLEDQLREALKTAETAAKENHDLNKSNKELTDQLAVLQEKREKGLQEVQKLTKLLESARNNGASDGKTNQKHINGTADQVYNEVFKQFQPVKKAIDHLYKEIVITISNQKIQEFSEENGNKRVLKDIMPGFAEALIKIEKKINDVNLLVLEFSDYLE